MFWKEELIATRADSEVFLKDAVRFLIPERRFVVNYADGENDDLFITVVAEEDVGKKKGAKAELELDFYDDGHLQISDIDIHETLRKKGLALILMKCACAIVAERGGTYIEVEFLVGQGFGFWPYIGAKSLEPPLALAATLKAKISNSTQQPEAVELRQLEFIADLAAEDASLGFRALAFSSFKKASANTIRNQSFDALLYRKNAIFDLTDKTTIHRLTEKLGRLPDFDKLPVRNDPSNKGPLHGLER